LEMAALTAPKQDLILMTGTYLRIVKTCQYAIGREAANREAESLLQYVGDKYTGPPILKRAGNTKLFTHDESRRSGDTLSMTDDGQKEPVTIDANRTELPLNHFREHYGKVPLRYVISFVKFHRQ